jgi:hypothetical protein
MDCGGLVSPHRPDRIRYGIAPPMRGGGHREPLLVESGTDDDRGRVGRDVDVQIHSPVLEGPLTNRPAVGSAERAQRRGDPATGERAEPKPAVAGTTQGCQLSPPRTAGGVAGQCPVDDPSGTRHESQKPSVPRSGCPPGGLRTLYMALPPLQEQPQSPPAKDRCRRLSKTVVIGSVQKAR